MGLRSRTGRPLAEERAATAIEQLGGDGDPRGHRAGVAGGRPEHHVAVERREQRLDDDLARRRPSPTRRPGGRTRRRAGRGRRARRRPRRGRACRRWRRAARAFRSSSVRHSTASAPWPTCGSMTDGSRYSVARSASPSRSSAAAATTMASKLGSLLEAGGDVAPQLGEREVGPPRRELRAPPHRTGRHARPAGSASRVDPTSASRGSARSGTAASTSPRARPIAGRSLAECTARSARPSSTACCTSFTKMPVPPTAWIGTSVRASPVVETITSSTSPPSSVGDAVGLPARQRAAARRHAQRARHQPSEPVSASSGSGRPNSSTSASA